MKWLMNKILGSAQEKDTDNGDGKSLNPSQNIEDIKWVVIDIESTGLDTKKDRILSISTLEIENMEISVGSLHQWLVYQANPTLNKAVEIHGIMPSETKCGKPEDEVLKELLEVIGNKPLLGHHVGFDVAMLNRAVQHHFSTKFSNKYVDTAYVAMQVIDAFHKTGYPGQHPPSLDELCSKLNITVFDRHSASGDTLATAQAFLMMCAQLRKRFGRPVKFKDLL